MLWSRWVVEFSHYTCLNFQVQIPISIKVLSWRQDAKSKRVISLQAVCVLLILQKETFGQTQSNNISTSKVYGEKIQVLITLNIYPDDILLLRLVSVCPNISLSRAHQAATLAQGWPSICSSYGFRRGWTRSEATRRRRLRSKSQASARRLTARRLTVWCSVVSGESTRSV